MPRLAKQACEVRRVQMELEEMRCQRQRRQQLLLEAALKLLEDLGGAAGQKRGRLNRHTVACRFRHRAA